VWAKEGSMTAASWLLEFGGATVVSVASDPTNGPLIAVLSGTTVYAKEGSMTGATWTTELTGASSPALSVASDATNGLVIGVGPGVQGD
jgi:hypothetical protein